MTKETITSLKKEFELFAHTTSHDLRDPLRLAIQYCDDIKHERSPDLPDRIIKNLTEVLARIDLLREYSYLVTFDKALKDVDCNILLQQSLEKLNGKVTENKAEITYGKLPKIKAYEPDIIKVLTNLIDNAIKFRKSSTNPKINIACNDKDNFFEFKISDNGIGIDKVYRDLVFAIFQRLTPEVNDGSYGAGLAFCKKIVENHGGKIWFESDGENGTSFYFTLPK
jgi:light-regulated signal transduction histidine kinase (bacteriophytochrome)